MWRELMVSAALVPLLWMNGCSSPATGGEPASSSPASGDPTQSTQPIPVAPEVLLRLGQPALPLPTIAGVLSFGSQPPSHFTLSPGDSILIDVHQEDVEVLGRGNLGVFSTDGRTLAWNEGQLVHLLDIGTGVQWTLSARGLVAGFSAKDWLVLTDRDGTRLINVRTGDARDPGTPDVFSLVPYEVVGGTAMYIDRPSISIELKTFRFEHPGRPVVSGRAYSATLLDADHAVFAAPAMDDTRRVNLLLVDLWDGTVTQLAGVPLGDDASAGGGVPVVPIGAGAGRVAWTERFCTDQARLLVLDLATGAVTATDLDGWVDVTPAGQLALGQGFGATALLDLETGWTLVLPSAPSDTQWTSDYAYAHRGASGGHGAACPA